MISKVFLGNGLLLNITFKWYDNHEKENKEDYQCIINGCIGFTYVDLITQVKKDGRFPGHQQATLLYHWSY